VKKVVINSFAIILRGALRLMIVALIACTLGMALGRAAPRGDTLTFVGLPQGNSDVIAMDSGRWLRVNLTHAPTHEYHPSWSPDGQRLVFVSDRDGARHLYEQRVGGSPHRLNDLVIARGYRPLWSPDGALLLFEVEHGTNIDLYTMRMDCLREATECYAAPQRLTEDVTADRFPLWSPNGARILFTGWRTGDAELFAINADGTGLRNLTRDRGWDVNASWSPNGEWIAFLSDRNGMRELYMMNADGSHVRRLTHERNPYNAYSGTLAWSKASDAIAFVTTFDLNSELVLMPLTCGSAEIGMCRASPYRLARSRGTDVYPYWSEDGRWLYYVSDRDGMVGVYRLDPTCAACAPQRMSDASFENAQPTRGP
jgi:Tol biopolymer transport system component